MIKVTLKGGTVKEYPENITAMEIAKDIGMGLYKAACICRINDDFCDLRTELKEDCSLEFYSFEEAEEAKRCFRHSASHILAQAVKRLFPEAKLAIGPAVDNGFYYDFDTEKSFTAEDLERIEAEMKKNRQGKAAHRAL